MLKNLLVVCHYGCSYQDRVLTVKMAAHRTKEKLIIDEAAGTWRFADEKLAWLGTFKFGRGPTNEQKWSRYVSSKTQTVFDRMNNEHLKDAFTFLSSSAFGLGYKSGGAIDAD